MDGRITDESGQKLPRDGRPSRRGRRLGPRRSQQCLRRVRRRICAHDRQHGPYGVSARSEPEPFRLGGCDTALGPSFGLASHAAVDAHLRFFYLTAGSCDPARQEHFYSALETFVRRWRPATFDYVVHTGRRRVSSGLAGPHPDLRTREVARPRNQSGCSHRVSATHRSHSSQVTRVDTRQLDRR